MQVQQRPIRKTLTASPEAPSSSDAKPAAKMTPALQKALAKKAALDSLSLPEVAQEPSHNMADYGFLFLGERGVGKTTLASMFPNTFHLMFEPGGKSLRIRSRPVLTWEEALRYRDMVIAKPGYCDNVVIDTCYMSYERVFEYKLKEFGISDPKDEGWGNGWKLIEKEFRDWYYSFLNNGIGVICIAHTEEKEIKQKVKQPNGKYAYEVVGTKLRTEVGAQASRLFKAIIDVEGYYYQDFERSGQRFLRIKESDWVVAKNRIDGHFLFKNGEVMEEIPMGNSKEQAYANLCKAFNNQFTKEEVPQAQKPILSTPARTGNTVLKRK